MLTIPVSGVVNVLSEFAQVVRRQYAFIWLLARREIFDRYTGSVLGIAWALLHPLCLMSVYLFVFNVVFVTRMSPDMRVGVDYVAYFIAGYLPWMALQDTFARSCGAIADSRNLVKQVVFPLEVLPLRTVLAAAFPQLVGSAFLLVYLLVRGALPGTVLLWPLALLIQLTAATGVAFFLAAITVLIRDTREVLGVVLSMGLYLLPIIYLPGMLSGRMGFLLNFNPFSHFVWMYRDVWINGTILHPLSWVLAALFAGVFLVGGFWTFRRLKGFFGNYL